MFSEFPISSQILYFFEFDYIFLHIFITKSNISQKLWVDAVYSAEDSTFTFAGSGDTILARDGRPLVGSMAEVGISFSVSVLKPT